MRAISLAILLALQAVPPVNLDTIGPQVGDTAPDFALRDQHGASRTLSSLTGPNGTMLVFYRSADW
jgi:hypothetical protein